MISDYIRLHYTISICIIFKFNYIKFFIDAQNISILLYSDKVIWLLNACTNDPIKRSSNSVTKDNDEFNKTYCILHSPVLASKVTFSSTSKPKGA